MARVTCAISGIEFSCEHLPIAVSHTDGYYHPVFALPYNSLYTLYNKHCNGHLTDTDSYLLFLAFLHSTGKVSWKCPVSLSPSEQATIKLIEANIHSLIKVIEVSFSIDHPVFKQPSYKVTSATDTLCNISSFIKAWRDNISTFNAGYADRFMRDNIQKIENKLTLAIKSGSKLESYSHVVATWADKVGDFPPDKKEQWIKIIRSCFNTTKMFSTPLADIKEIKAYCEENIEVGTIHFHALMSVLKEGISRHLDFLGMSPLGLGYTLLPTDSSKNDVEVAAAIASAPVSAPVERDYPSKLDYIKAKLRYRTATIAASHATPTVTTDTGEKL